MYNYVALVAVVHGFFISQAQNPAKTIHKQINKQMQSIQM